MKKRYIEIGIPKKAMKADMAMDKKKGVKEGSKADLNADKKLAKKGKK